jgi:hypothetical protein
MYTFAIVLANALFYNGMHLFILANFFIKRTVKLKTKVGQKKYRSTDIALAFGHG